MVLISKIRTVIEFYNKERTYLSIDMPTHDQFHIKKGELKAVLTGFLFTKQIRSVIFFLRAKKERSLEP